MFLLLLMGLNPMVLTFALLVGIVLLALPPSVGTAVDRTWDTSGHAVTEEIS
jgi:Flp pilus assembly pilin Flp